VEKGGDDEGRDVSLMETSTGLKKVAFACIKPHAVWYSQAFKYIQLYSNNSSKGVFSNNKSKSTPWTRVHPQSLSIANQLAHSKHVIHLNPQSSIHYPEKLIACGSMRRCLRSQPWTSS